MYKAKFKTAYLQREIYVDATVTTDLEVLEMVTVTPPSGDTPASIAPATSPDTATHIIAQSDISATPYEHVPTELGRYDTWNYQTVAASTEWKHVALYKIYDLDDLVTREVTD